jgi:hypothetical protein
LEVTAYFPAGTLSFIAKQAEQPGWRNTNPDLVGMSNNPSSLICFYNNWYQPSGTLSAFFFLLQFL